MFVSDSFLCFIVLYRLISTDATARGIDIKGVKCIINYDAPQFIRSYIHRCVCLLVHTEWHIKVHIYLTISFIKFYHQGF